MKAVKTILTIALAATATVVFAQENSPEASANPSSVGDLPNRRAGITVPPGQQSPYGLPQQKKKVQSTKRQYSQEDQIREIFSKLFVTGIIGNGKKVLLHNITLEEGEIVANVLRNQTEVLLVKEITPERVYIEWIEQTRRKRPRTMEIPIDMSPRVEAIVPGQRDVSKKLMGIVRLRGSEEDQ